MISEGAVECSLDIIPRIELRKAGGGEGVKKGYGSCFAVGVEKEWVVVRLCWEMRRMMIAVLFFVFIVIVILLRLLLLLFAL